MIVHLTIAKMDQRDVRGRAELERRKQAAIIIGIFHEGFFLKESAMASPVRKILGVFPCSTHEQLFSKLSSCVRVQAKVVG